MTDTGRLVFEHHGMALTYDRDEQTMVQYALNTSGALHERVSGLAVPNFQAAIAGRPAGFVNSMVSGLTAIPNESRLETFSHDAAGLHFRYKHEATGLAFLVDLELVPGAAVIRSTVTAINEGPQAQVLTHLSSLCMQGIATDGGLEWHDPRKIRVHYCIQTWEGEGQWRSAGLEELGIYPASVHPESTGFQVCSVGSFSTARFYPACFVEDLETRKIWYFQIETSSSWHYEISYRGDWTLPNGGLFLHADAADERALGWAHRLEPGERFTTVPAAVGCCAGTVEDAVRELTRYRRSVLKPAPAWETAEAPLFFNDYMNCLWGNPTKEALLPLIDAAAAAGAEGFCIDAGWFGPRGNSWADNLGIWEPSTERFDELGVPGILALIRKKGMIPGLWLEMEVCGEQTELARTKPEDWFLRRHGRRVGGGARLFFNFANPAVREYYHGVIDRLVALGCGYFKNDYNECTGSGDDTLGTTAADGLLAHSRAFYAFIDEVRARHPRLILENCGSGAMRSDNGILAHFHLQSISDQEIYHLMPPVLNGALANVLPEQLGIWVTPFPLLFLDNGKPEILDTPAYQAAQADGEETIFNIVSGLCGNFYLSGRIDKADAAAMALIQEGCALYKRERAHLHHGFPLWPLGFNRINQPGTWAAQGIANEANDRVLLAVWRRTSAEATMTLPLHGWAGRAARVRQLYPAAGHDVECCWNQGPGTLTVTLPRTLQARYFEICV